MNSANKDPRYEAQYPDLPYVFFLVPRNAVNDIKTYGNRVALNTNLNTARAAKAEMLKRYLVRSQQEFQQFKEEVDKSTTPLSLLRKG